MNMIPCPRCNNELGQEYCLLCDGAGFIATPTTGAEYLKVSMEKWIEEALAFDPSWVAMVNNLTAQQRSLFLKLRTGVYAVDQVLDALGEGFADEAYTPLVIGASYEYNTMYGAVTDVLYRIIENIDGTWLEFIQDPALVSPQKIIRRV